MRKRLGTLCFVVCAFLVSIMIQNCNLNPGRAFLTVNELRWNGCGECTAMCLTDAIRMIKRKAVIDPTRCVECGRCVEVCPVNAIQ